MFIDDLKTRIAKIDEVRQGINSFLIESIKAGAFTDSLKLAAQISAMVASGGANPLAAMEALKTLTQINADLAAAKAAVHADNTVPESPPAAG